MASRKRVLAQAVCKVGENADLYRVPNSIDEASLSSLIICNTGDDYATFNIFIAIGGAATSIKQYIYWKIPLGSCDTFIASDLGIILQKDDVIRVKSESVKVSFQAVLVEITN